MNILLSTKTMTCQNVLFINYSLKFRNCLVPYPLIFVFLGLIYYCTSGLYFDWGVLYFILQFVWFLVPIKRVKETSVLFSHEHNIKYFWYLVHLERQKETVTVSALTQMKTIRILSGKSLAFVEGVIWLQLTLKGRFSVLKIRVFWLLD